MQPTRVTLAVAALLLAVTGCSGGSAESGAEASATPSTSAGTTAAPSEPAQAKVPPAPPREGCYRLTLKELAQPTNESSPVPCTKRHDTQTFYVGRLDTVVAGHAVAVDSRTVQRQLARACPARLADYLGGTQEVRDLTRFRVVWFSPTIPQSDQGADWFRCDLIAFDRGDALYPLPPPGKLRKALDRDGALSTYGLCGTSAPGAKGFERVICSRKHSWVAFTTVPLSGGAAYPGKETVRSGGEDDCKAAARERSGNALKYEYGWEWPTRAQWRAGQRYGFCWAPS